MKENKLTGNDMFKMVEVECERSLGSVNKPKFEQNYGNKNEVLYSRLVDGNWDWSKSGDDKKDDKYFGEVENGVPNGQGTETYTNGNEYIGEFKNGNWNGQGIVTTSDGSKYTGGHKDGLRHGRGTMIFSDGLKIVGSWMDNEELVVWSYGDGSGYATYASVDGRLDDEMNRRVAYSENKEALYKRKVNGEWGWYKSGDEKVDDKYVGEVENGVPNGIGKFGDSSRVHVGEWKDGKENGLGIATWSNGEKYKGEFKNGILEYGVMYGKNGEIIGRTY
jgi:hypothetical protein